SGMPAARRPQAALIVALYSVLMPLLGILAGERLSDSAASTATYVAGFGLIVAGAYGLYCGWGASEDEEAVVEIVLEGPHGTLAVPSEAHHAVHLTALLSSMDKLAVGLALGAQDIKPWGALVYLGLQSFALAFLGMAMGEKLGVRLGYKAELVSKALLLAVGTLIVLSHVLELNLAGYE
ncbi:MAG TPA: manganese efflux pump, partial [Dehalococcoidia bacterium]